MIEPCLWDYLVPPENGTVHRVGVIGICKNAGKTSTLNHLVSAGAERGICLALASTGRDGEAHDEISGSSKPRIFTPAGNLVITTSGALKESSARVEIIERLSTSLLYGTALLGRVIRPGFVVLTRVGTACDITEALQRAERHCAQLCLVDGAFDRIISARSDIAQTVVVAVGAMYLHRGDLHALIEHTKGLVERFATPLSRFPCLDLPGNSCYKIVGMDGEVLSACCSWADLPEQLGEDLHRWRNTESTVFLAGAFTDVIAGIILERKSVPSPVFDTCVVVDASRILLSADGWRRWRQSGHSLAVLSKVNIKAITTNPFREQSEGEEIDPAAFCATIAGAVGLPTFDLVTRLFHFKKVGISHSV